MPGTSQYPFLPFSVVTESLVFSLAVYYIPQSLQQGKAIHVPKVWPKIYAQKCWRYFQNLLEMGKACPSLLYSCCLECDGWSMVAILDQLPVLQRISQEKARILMTLKLPYQPQTAYLQASFSWGRNNLSHHCFLFFCYMQLNLILTDILIPNECLLN